MVICNKKNETHLVFNLYSSEDIALESSPPFIHTKRLLRVCYSQSYSKKTVNYSQFINPPHSGVTPVSLRCWCYSGAVVTPVSLRY